MVATCVNENATVETCSCPADILSCMAGAFDERPEQEQVWLIFLNRQNKIKGRLLLTIGTQTASLADPREIIRAALLANATAFVMVHNHPSGNPYPSAEDVFITKTVRDAAKICAMVFQDHVIVGDSTCDSAGKGYYSFKEAGLI